MKDTTLAALYKFIGAVESLAMGTVLICGHETTTEVIDAGERLRQELGNEIEEGRE